MHKYLASNWIKIFLERLKIALFLPLLMLPLTTVRAQNSTANSKDEAVILALPGNFRIDSTKTNVANEINTHLAWTKPRAGDNITLSFPITPTVPFIGIPITTFTSDCSYNFEKYNIEVAPVPKSSSSPLNIKDADTLSQDFILSRPPSGTKSYLFNISATYSRPTLEQCAKDYTGTVPVSIQSQSVTYDLIVPSGTELPTAATVRSDVQPTNVIAVADWNETSKKFDIKISWTAPQNKPDEQPAYTVVARDPKRPTWASVADTDDLTATTTLAPNPGESITREYAVLSHYAADNGFPAAEKISLGSIISVSRPQDGSAPKDKHVTGTSTPRPAISTKS